MMCREQVGRWTWRCPVALSIVIAVFTAVLPVAHGRADEKVALVIGNAAYQNVSRLPNTSNDAGDMADKLRRLGFNVVHHRDLGKASFEAALLRFRRAASAARVAMIFYAGHGIGVDHQTWLIPVDAELRHVVDIEFESIELDLLLHSVAEARDLRLVVLDSCRNNPFLSTMVVPKQSRSISRGLAKIEPKQGDTLIWYAAKDGSVAEDGDGRNSPFTTALLTHIDRPGVEIDYLFRVVRDSVLRDTKNKQEPFQYGSRGLKNFYFNPQSVAVPGFARRDQETPAQETLLARANSFFANDEFEQAAALYESAAKRNIPAAMVALGNLHARGLGRARNAETAHGWYIKAARLGDPVAEFLVGRNNERGTAGVKQDRAEALKWYRSAASKGNADAMNNIAVMYALGEGVAKDPAEAVNWYRKAAEAGNSNAMFNLAAQYDDGLGLKKSPDDAAHWVLRSIAAGNTDALLQMTSNSKAWSRAFRLALQQKLTGKGVYDGAIDGAFGRRTIGALKNIAGEVTNANGS